MLLEALLAVLELFDSVVRALISAAGRIATAGGAGEGEEQRRAKAGSRPPPPRVIGIILAEPNVSDVSIRTVSRLTSW